jgi:Ca2+:H+ antiporter
MKTEGVIHAAWQTVRVNKMLLLLPLTPLPLVLHAVMPDAHTFLFVISILSILPLTVILALATEQLAARTGDTIGGLLNATLGNLSELIIALAALKAGEYLLVKASLAGAIVTNTLFLVGMSFFLGGLRHNLQKFNSALTRVQSVLLFLAAFGLLFPSAIAATDLQVLPQSLSVAISVILLGVYGLSLVFTLGTHRKFFSAAATAHAESGQEWPVVTAVIILCAATVMVALVSEVFIESLNGAAATLQLTPAFVGFIVVAVVGAASAMTAAFKAARADRLDLSIGISLGSAVQIALFVAPVLVLLSHVIGPTPMSLQFWPGAVVMIFIAALTAALTTSSGRSAWFVGVLLLMVYAIFATTLFVMPPTH